MFRLCQNDDLWGLKLLGGQKKLIIYLVFKNVCNFVYKLILHLNIITTHVARHFFIGGS